MLAAVAYNLKKLLKHHPQRLSLPKPPPPPPKPFLRLQNRHLPTIILLYETRVLK